jgi:hypothetical protein
MVTSISFPLLVLVTVALDPIGRLGWAALRPPVRISWVAPPRWLKFPILVWAKLSPQSSSPPMMTNKNRFILTPFPQNSFFPETAPFSIIDHYR